MRLSAPLSLLGSVLALLYLFSACAPSGDAGPRFGAPGPERASAFTQTSFRVDGGSPTRRPVEEREAAVVLADHPFVVRLEVEGVPGPDARFRLQARRNGGAWEHVVARDFPYPDEISTPRVSIVSATAVSGAIPLASTDALTGSTRPFVEARTVSLDSLSASWDSPGGMNSPTVHGEWVWPVVVRRWADGPVTNEGGDVFELRMVDELGHPVLPPQDGPYARVVLEIPEGLLGGTYPETPGVLGPWQARNGDLYFPMEPAETFNVLMMMRSSDGGRSWVEVDGGHRPATDDLEGFATTFHDGSVFMLHQISEATYLHAFRTSDDAEAPDSWEIRDELVVTHSEPPVQVAALAARSDGSLVAVYGDSVGLEIRVRAPGGGWGRARRIPTEAGLVASGIMAVRGYDDTVHLAYTVGDARRREVWYTAFASDGRMAVPRMLADGVGTAEEEIGAVAPLGFLPETGTVAVLYRLADGSLRERRIGPDGAMSEEARVTERAVVQNGSDSDQVGADVVVHDGTVHVLFIDEETRNLWHTSSARPGVWSPASPVVSGVNAQWVRGAVVRGDGEGARYGFVYDAGSDGGSGMNWYDELPLPLGP